MESQRLEETTIHDTISIINVQGSVPMDATILLILSISFAVINNLLLHGFNNKGLRGIGDVLLFNAFVSAVWLVILIVFNWGEKISASAWLWGAVYGSVMSAFLLCKMQAMATGPVSITSFIGCSSLLISTAFGILYFHEKVSVVQTVGVGCLLVALFLTVSKSRKNSEQQAKVEKSWSIWCVLFFLCSGATGIIFKLHQSSGEREAVNQMMLAAAVTSTALFLIFSLLVQRKIDKTLPRIPPHAWIFVIACGIVSCGYNRMNISLSGMLPSILFFPLFNGLVILLASLLAAALFREKITKRQMLGIIIGLGALLMVSGGG